MIELIIGGARSGKSALAEERARESGWPVIYIATAEAGDHEMAQRIAHHQRQRPAGWRVIEEALCLAKVLKQQAAAQHFILVDCLTLWLTNLLCRDEANNSALLETETAALLEILPNLPGRIVLVSNEVGSGIVPLGAINRVFVDEQGRLNQRLARIADRVTLVAAGLPLELK